MTLNQAIFPLGLCTMLMGGAALAAPAAATDDGKCPTGMHCTQFATWTHLIPTRQVKPKFPLERHGEDAQCKVRVTVGADGRVEDAAAVSEPACPDAFGKKSEKAAMKWRFEPFDADAHDGARDASFVLAFDFDRR